MFLCPALRESLSQPEVNSLALQDNRLYVGSGNHDVQVIDLETRIKVASLRGHTDYIHSVRVRSVHSSSVFCNVACRILVVILFQVVCFILKFN